MREFIQTLKNEMAGDCPAIIALALFGMTLLLYGVIIHDVLRD